MESIIPVVFKQALFWLSYLVFPAIYVAARFALTKGQWRLWAGLSLIPLLLFTYARFIEPQRLITQTHKVELCGDGLPGSVRLAVAADFHIGIFPNAVSVGRIVREVKKSDAQALLIPGDFTYHLPPSKMAKAFAPLAELEIPVIAVMGNHDEGMPGPDLSDPLIETLEGLGVTILDPGVTEIRLDGKYLRIVGTRDYWAARRDGGGVGEGASRLDMATIVLQHNPDLIKDYDEGQFDLFVAGHTHGGQVMLPWITCRFTFACRTLREGYQETPVGKLFVTAGTGMTTLPIRFGVPPRVDLLDVEISRCRVSYDHLRNLRQLQEKRETPKPVKKSPQKRQPG